MHILMLAAENGALPGGKVGGMGDVVRDVPAAIAKLGHQVTVLTPGYGRFSRLPGAVRRGAVDTLFRGEKEAVDLIELGADAALDPATDSARSGVRQWVLEHPEFAVCGAGHIYCDDPHDRPFASDASKFALFCAAAAGALISGQLRRPDVIHLHDWHSAVLAVLTRCDPNYDALSDIPLVYTIHNLALQGIRPLDGDPSSLRHWFPGLAITRDALCDPRYRDCFNPMRAAIALSDKVHAVSPTYAREICDPKSDSGAGLQADLKRARDSGRLEGILNGCEYPRDNVSVLPFAELMRSARDILMQWIGTHAAVSGADLVALRRLDQWIEEGRVRPARLLTSVGRLTEQKVGLLMERMADGRSSLEQLLSALQDDELLVILGSGDPALEASLGELASRYSQLLFLRGFSDSLAGQLYAAGDLFLMPSTFEPCGISQMLAMRAGQPCVVNAVGGLADTVTDGVTGFVFDAAASGDGAAAMLRRCEQALDILRNHPSQVKEMRESAAAARFYWKDAAQAYISRLYCS